MKDNCEKCPCTPEGVECWKRPDYCAWAAAGETIRFAHIVNTSRIVQEPWKIPLDGVVMAPQKCCGG